MGNPYDEEASDIWFICKYCGRGYKEAKSLIAHKRANHMAELIERKRQKEHVVEVQHLEPHSTSTPQYENDHTR